MSDGNSPGNLLAARMEELESLMATDGSSTLLSEYDRLADDFRRLGGCQGLDILVRQEQGRDCRRHDDRAAQNGPGRDEGTCFAHEILNDVELPVW